MLTANWDSDRDKKGDIRHYYFGRERPPMAAVCVEPGKPGKWEIQYVAKLDDSDLRRKTAVELTSADLKVA